MLQEVIVALDDIAFDATYTEGECMALGALVGAAMESVLRPCLECMHMPI